MEQSQKNEFKHLVRIANTDIDGNKNINRGLKNIKGIGWMMSEAILKTCKINSSTKAGNLTEEQIKMIDDTIKNPSSKNIPSWMFNRKKDPETGEDKHLIGADLDFSKQEDIRKMKKIRSYKGIRHIKGLPVRGQKTRSNFRRNKGKAMGVKKKKTTGKT